MSRESARHNVGHCLEPVENATEAEPGNERQGAPQAATSQGEEENLRNGEHNTDRNRTHENNLRTLAELVANIRHQENLMANLREEFLAKMTEIAEIFLPEGGPAFDAKYRQILDVAFDFYETLSCIGRLNLTHDALGS